MRCSSSSSNNSASSSSICPADVDVIILGAGISGLAAAQVLHSQGLTCLILEARNRSGGRIHSLSLNSTSINNSSPITIDLGANYLHGCTTNQTIQPLFRMAQLLDMESAVTMGDLHTSYRGWDNPELAIWRQLSLSLPTTIATTSSCDTSQTALSSFDIENQEKSSSTSVNSSTAMTINTNLSRPPKRLCSPLFMPGQIIVKKPRRNNNNNSTINTIPIIISPQQVADMVFLLDRCIVTLIWLNNNNNNNSTTINSISTKIPLSFDQQFEKALQFSLQLLYKTGKRKSEWLNDLEKEILYSLRSKYICYVRTADDLPATMPQGDKYQRDAASGMATSVKYPNNADKRDYFDMILLKKQIYENQYKTKCEYNNNNNSNNTTSTSSNNNDTLNDSNDSGIVINSLEAFGEIGKSMRIRSLEEDRLVLSGFQKITDCLAQSMDIRYNHIVKQIFWNQTDCLDYPITIMTQNNDQQQCCYFRSRYCIVTLPVGVLAGLHPLSAVEFIPPLPSYKIDAIRRLAPKSFGQPTHDKIILQFHEKDIFWESTWPQLNANDPRVHLLNLHAYGKIGVLLAHVWADSHWDLFGKSDLQIKNEMMDLLTRMYPEQAIARGGQLPNPIEFIVTRWSEDPFSLASYTAGGLFCLENDREMYRSVLPAQGPPQIFFAGEATPTYSEVGQQCTHGAFLSGIARAVDIVRDFCGTCNMSKSQPVDYLFRTCLNPRSSEVMEEQFMKSRNRAMILHCRKVDEMVHCMQLRSHKKKTRIISTNNNNNDDDDDNDSGDDDNASSGCTSAVTIPGCDAPVGGGSRGCFSSKQDSGETTSSSGVRTSQSSSSSSSSSSTAAATSVQDVEEEVEEENNSMLSLLLGVQEGQVGKSVDLNVKLEEEQQQKEIEETEKEKNFLEPQQQQQIEITESGVTFVEL